MVEEASGALDGKIVSSEPTGTLIGHSAFLCMGGNHEGFFALYHDFFDLHLRDEKKFADGG
jgi:hypothetical protein